MWEWDDFVAVGSAGAVEVTVVPNGLVIWSAGNDSGTVCNVDRIVVDILNTSNALCDSHKWI